MDSGHPKKSQVHQKKTDPYIIMGAGSSSEIPGGGTEGYHVLRVSIAKLTKYLNVRREPKASIQPAA